MKQSCCELPKQTSQRHFLYTQHVGEEAVRSNADSVTLGVAGFAVPVTVLKFNRCFMDT